MLNKYTPKKEQSYLENCGDFFISMLKTPSNPVGEKPVQFVNLAFLNVN